MLETTLTTRAGLFTTGRSPAPVPLAGISIEADLRGFHGRVVVSQRYVNRESTPIEAVYVFPLDESAAVCGFEALIGDTRVVGEVHERDRAFEIYDDAMEAGHGAFLLDEERPDVFQASIGNLAPGTEVIVRLTYVTELNTDEGRLRFVIPTTVSPRYAPAADQVRVGRPDSVALNPPVASSVPYGLNLAVRAHMPQGITAMECPSHRIALRMDAQGATVSLVQQDAALDRDFVLSIEAPGLDAPQAVVERDDDGRDTVGVAFAPLFATASTPAELIFLVDRSGSMAGSSIDEVRNALQLCLRSMTSGCRFNIIGFGSDYQALFLESRAYEQRTLAAASAHVSRIDADLGGTEILPALRFALEQSACGELPRQIVVLTDGEVTNTDAVIALAAAHAHHARLFTFGIGAGASHHLVRGLARAGGGTAEFIYPGERIERKVLRQVSRLLSPALTDVRVDWIGGTVTQAPATIPPVFSGSRLLLYGFVKGERPASVRLTATGPSGALSFDVPLSDAIEGGQRIVATLAARARIRELEEGAEWLSTRGSRQRDRKAGSARGEIIRLSRRYGVMSRETSFVAVEQRDRPAAAGVQLRKVPIALTTGWGGLTVSEERYGSALSMARLAPSGAAGRAGAARLPPWSVVEETADWDEDDAEDADETFDGELMAPAASVHVRSPATAGARATPSAAMALILLQNADGSWDLTSELASVVGRELAELLSLAQTATGPTAAAKRAWATALALAWLERHAAGDNDQWRLLAVKAGAWLNAASAVLPGGRTWLEEARDVLAR